MEFSLFFHLTSPHLTSPAQPAQPAPGPLQASPRPVKTVENFEADRHRRQAWALLGVFFGGGRGMEVGRCGWNFEADSNFLGGQVA